MISCLLIYVWQHLLLSDVGTREATYAFGVVPAVLSGEKYLPPEVAVFPPWASVLTSMFMHGGFWHLAGNMLYLWIFGNNIEDRLGGALFAFFYLGGGVVAGVTQTAIDPESTIPLIGASGAIAASLGAYFVFFPGARITTLVFLGFFYQLIEVPAIIVLGFWFALQLLDGIGSLGMETGAGVAFFAHIGGFVAGALVAWLMIISGRVSARGSRVG